MAPASDCPGHCLAPAVPAVRAAGGLPPGEEALQASPGLSVSAQWNSGHREGGRPFLQLGEAPSHLLLRD